MGESKHTAPVYETDGHRWYAFVGGRQIGYDPLRLNSGHFATRREAVDATHAAIAKAEGR